jgi:hypothetical protein
MDSIKVYNNFHTVQIITAVIIKYLSNAFFL